MSQPALKPWTETEFFAWHERQERRHELVDGQPRAMTGASNGHNRIAFATAPALDRRLRGGPCRPMPFDQGLRIPSGNIRYPDVTVDCGRCQREAYVASEPVLVVEVFSPSTRAFDRARKLEEYRSVPTLRHILLLDPHTPATQLHTRDAEGAWRWQISEDPAASVPLTALDITLPPAECYEGAF